MSFFRQVQALTWKNLLVVAFRHPVGFLLTFYCAPIAILIVLAMMPTWILGNLGRLSRLESPSGLTTLNNAIFGGQKLVISQTPNLGADALAVITKITQSVDKDKLILFHEPVSRLGEVCNPRGNECFAVVRFMDSPETAIDGASGRNATWNYNIRTNSVATPGHKGSDESVLLPSKQPSTAPSPTPH
ncbi:hypothetical protein VHEMI04422 [[Torrubiella] hemipterigena]|uniref:Uncharacterized protein n=1 Tax=[Torrubiella] hemipterigena TaxID=1531966 RepID=A0A0A1SV74_9HYPO|nr:hypothetical protein VHEMI04422 [[Torrubiella] hemipterigena]